MTSLSLRPLAGRSAEIWKCWPARSRSTPGRNTPTFLCETHADGFSNPTLTKGPDLWTKSVTTNCNNTDCTDDRQPLRQTLVFPETTRCHSTHSWFSLYLRESCFRSLLSHCYSYQCRTFSNCRMCKSLRPSSETFRIGSKCWCCENRVHYASYGRWSRKLQPYWLLTQVWRVNTLTLMVLFTVQWWTPSSYWFSCGRIKSVVF